MVLKNNVYSTVELLQNYFKNQTRPVQKQLSFCTICMTLAGKFNMQEVIRKMCILNDRTFSTNENNLYNLLDSDNFQVDDKMFRCYLNFLFDSLVEKGLKNADLLQINVDYTSIEEKFLILYASIIYENINYPFYFSLRCDPNEPNFDQKLMEKAFINGLKHALSKKYNYVVVADRGFGNSRFLDLCVNGDFDFCIRLNSNLKIFLDEKEINLQDFEGQNTEFMAVAKRWNKPLKFIVSTENDKTWFLATNTTNINKNAYKNRFKIETMFKNFKSSCFDIEKTKIKNYSRLKKMLFISMFSFVLISSTKHL
jgi:hypothetical protein